MGAIEKRIGVILLSAALLASLVVACDASRLVVITNRSATDVTVTVSGPPESTYVLAPGQARETAWLFPVSPEDDRRRRIEARDANGLQVYCRLLGFQDLSALNWKVEVRANEQRCDKG